MEIIRDEDRSFKELVGLQPYDSDVNHIESKYVTLYRNGDYVYALNSLTGFVGKIKMGEVSTKWLVQHWFLMPEYIDQFTAVHFSDYLIRKKAMINNGWLTQDKGRSFVIMTTSGCNARCPYCYEKGCTPKVMTTEVADAVVDYITNYGKKEIDLTWFGGEPLLNIPIIDYICKKLKDRNIYFVSRITTNGYFLSKVSNYKLRYEWNVSSFQVTLDSYGDEYEKIKGFDDGTYERILDTMKRISDIGIKVRVRLNTTAHNIEGLKHAIDDIASLEIPQDLLGVYTAPVDSIETDEEKEIKFNGLLELDEYMHQYGLLEYKQLRDFTVQPFSCMADRWDCLVINPEGKISCCEHEIDGGIGDVWKGITKPEAFEEWSIKRPPMDICKDCKCLPFCIKLKNCKGFADCSVYEKHWWESRILSFLKHIYEKEKSNDTNSSRVCLN